jgi:molecular chaperone GrpE
MMTAKNDDQEMRQTAADDLSKEAAIEQEQTSSEVQNLQAELERVSHDAQKAQESERRAIADYQNLMRRTQEDRAKMIKMASRSVVESILQPLEHLFLAKEQLKDKGIDMVYQQFVQALQNEGLEEIQVMGKDFDPSLMEVVDKQPVDDKKQIGKVIQVAKRGYRLNGEVIDHAKVVIGVEHE